MNNGIIRGWDGVGWGGGGGGGGGRGTMKQPYVITQLLTCLLKYEAIVMGHSSAHKNTYLLFRDIGEYF